MGEEETDIVFIMVCLLLFIVLIGGVAYYVINMEDKASPVPGMNNMMYDIENQMQAAAPMLSPLQVASPMQNVMMGAMHRPAHPLTRFRNSMMAPAPPQPNANFISVSKD